MGHPQPPTRIQVEYTTANAFSSKTLKQERSKAINMRLYCIQDICSQRKFKTFWISVATNLSGYNTNHYSPARHWLICQKYLHIENLINQLKVCLLQGCDSSLVGAHPCMPGNSPGQTIPRYASIPAHRRNTRQKSHSRTSITTRAKYGPIRAIRS